MSAFHLSESKTVKFSVMKNIFVLSNGSREKYEDNLILRNAV
jgi:hypothetical protein